MASAVDCGVGTLRDVTGLCDWCGDECHPNQEICVALSCHRCDSKLYHQSCVEKYLKKMGLAANRKTGFPCPFGKGKVSQEECKGKVEKSHPIVPKNEDKKKARMAPQVLEAMAKPPKAPKPAPAKPAQVKPAPMPRKLAPPKPHQLPSASVWGQKGAAPVLANAHLPAPDPEPAAAQPRPAELPVGLVLEEAMTKAQKKNLARKKKRAAAGQETLSEASSDHQDNMAGLGAGAASADMVPAAAMGGAAAAALVGFDGTAFNAQNTMLEQQGHRFITDAAQYAALLGLYADSDDEADDGDDSEQEADHTGSGNGYDEQVSADGMGAAAYPPAVRDNNSAGFSPNIAPAVVSPAPVVPVAPVVAPQPAETKDIASEQAAFNAAVAASIQQYQLEEEMRRQREVLTSGYGGAFGGGGVVSKAPPAAYPYPGIGTPNVPVQAPVAAPVVAPVAVPVAAPVAAPLPAPHAPSVLYHQTKQQPEAPVAHYGNNGWVFGGGNQGQVLPPHMPAAYAAPAGPAYDQGGQFAAMAAGHSAPEVAGDEDDDDLSTLLALCGVAG